MRALISIALAFAALPAGCKRKGADPHTDPQAKPHLLSAKPSPQFPARANLIERRGQGRAAYLGFDVSPKTPPPRPGEVVELTHYFAVEVPFANDYQVFVHGEPANGGERLVDLEHHPVGGHAATSTWKKGDIWADRHKLTIPREATGDAMLLWVGMLAGEERLTVETEPGGADGENRIKAGRLPISAGGAQPQAQSPQPQAPQDDLPSVAVSRARKPIKPDGVLDEPEWQAAQVMTFADSMGRGTEVKFPTRLRLLWDDDNLYAAFESTDVDASDPFSKRDDPIYDHEAVELFIMPKVRAPDLGPYVELQASPKGTIFDAAFTARRQNFDTSFNAAQTVGTKVDGTIDDPSDRDRGWVSEWSVPWKSLRGVEAAPKAGDEWRLNAFRIEKWREGGQMQGEYTAWSPPRVGDFHNTARFGRMKMVE